MPKISAADGPTDERLPGYYDLGTVQGDAADANGVPVHSPEVTVTEDGDKLDGYEDDGTPKVTEATDEERGILPDEEEGDESSDGNSSSPSGESNVNSPKKSDSKDPSPAPTMASPSKKGQTVSSSAPSTAGDPGKAADK